MMSADTVTFNITGTIFMITSETLEKLKQLSAKCACLLQEAEKCGSKGEIFMEKDPACFAALLQYCRHGNLHLPKTLCPHIFKEEMASWGVDLSRLSNCCYNTMVSCLHDRTALEHFESGFFQETPKEFMARRSRWQTYRARLWTMLDKPFSSRLAKVSKPVAIIIPFRAQAYFLVFLTFLMTSLFSMIVSTHPAFRRDLDLDEWQSALGSDFSRHEEYLGKHYGLGFPPPPPPPPFFPPPPPPPPFFPPLPPPLSPPSTPPSDHEGPLSLDDDPYSGHPHSSPVRKKRSSGKSPSVGSISTGHHSSRSSLPLFLLRLRLFLPLSKFQPLSDEEHHQHQELTASAGKTTFTEHRNRTRTTAQWQDDLTLRVSGEQNIVMKPSAIEKTSGNAGGRRVQSALTEQSKAIDLLKNGLKEHSEFSAVRESPSFYQMRGKIRHDSDVNDHPIPESGSSNVLGLNRKNSEQPVDTQSRSEEMTDNIMMLKISQSSNNEPTLKTQKTLQTLLQQQNWSEPLRSKRSNPQRWPQRPSKGPSDETSQGTSDETSQGTSDETSQGPSDETSQGHSNETSQGPPNETSQGPSNETSQRLSNGISQGLSDETYQGPSTARSPGPSSEISDAGSHRTSETTSVGKSSGGSPTESEGLATETTGYTGEEAILSKIRARMDFLDYLDYACLSFFVMDLTLRLIVSPQRCKFFCDLLTMADMLALLASASKLLIDNLLPRAKYTVSAVDIIDCLQILRFLRFFRLLRDVVGFKVLLHSVKASTYELLLLVMFVSSGMLVFSTVIFWCERDNMGSIPEAFWWAIVTMTTVGYGDLAPTTFLGKVVGSLCAISGVILVAITIPVLVNNFLLFYGYSKVIEARQKQHKKKEIHRKWRRLTRRLMSSTGNGSAIRPVYVKPPASTLETSWGERKP